MILAQILLVLYLCWGLTRQDRVLLHVHGIICTVLMLVLYLQDVFLVCVHTVIILSHIRGLLLCGVHIKEIELRVRNSINKIIY